MFNANQLLNTLLSAGQDLAQQGQSMVNQQLPQDQGERSAMMNGMGKGALAAGALALLLGTKTGRSVGGGALKVGSLAALGGLAYTAYQKWQAGNETPTSQTTAHRAPQPLEDLSENDINHRSVKILQAIIAAAKADGHIDTNERATINQFVEKLGNSSELSAFIDSELNKPLNPEDIATDVDAPGLASEIYLMSRLIIDDSNFMEEAYLNELANALSLDANLVAQLDAQALEATA